MPDLDAIRQDAFRLISRGVADRRSPYRTPALGTVGADGRPQLRTVVLRAFDPAARVLTVHSDVRAAKIVALAGNPAVALLFWDAGAQVQVRVDGVAAVLTGDDMARAEWARLHAGARASYRVLGEPGRAVPDPALVVSGDEAAAFGHFAVVRIAMAGLEWLHLAREGHRRARFAWTGADAVQEWLVP